MFQMHQTSILHLVAMASLLTVSSCSIGFNRDWNLAANTPATQNPQDLSGAWTGAWNSEGTSHQGKLRAIATKTRADGKVDHYTFRYHATWASVLSGQYKTEHIATPTRLGYHTLSGQHDMGAVFGGIYQYGGQASPTDFQATYRSKVDHGSFNLKRPAAK